MPTPTFSLSLVLSWRPNFWAAADPPSHHSCPCLCPCPSEICGIVTELAILASVVVRSRTNQTAKKIHTARNTPRWAHCSDHIDTAICCLLLPSLQSSSETACPDCGALPEAFPGPQSLLRGVSSTRTCATRVASLPSPFVDVLFSVV